MNRNNHLMGKARHGFINLKINRSSSLYSLFLACYIHRYIELILTKQWTLLIIHSMVTVELFILSPNEVIHR